MSNVNMNDCYAFYKTTFKMNNIPERKDIDILSMYPPFPRYCEELNCWFMFEDKRYINGN